MITGDKVYLDQLVGTHQCPEHPDKALNVAWKDPEGYVIRCGAGHYPEEITRVKSLTEQFKIGEPLPPPIADKVIKGQQRRHHAAGDQGSAALIGKIPTKDLSTGELLMPYQVEGLRRYALKYGLDPYRGHVVMMYGEPYFTIDAYYYRARESGEPYQLNSHPLTEEERRDYQIPEGAHAWNAEVVKDDGATRFTGLGIVTVEELTEESKNKPGQKRYPVVARYPWQLAQKRAEWQVMRRAFPIGEHDQEVSNGT